MTETEELIALIRADSAARGAPLSKLGYFCAPFRPPSGAFADRVVKVYRAMPDRPAAERLARAHDDYAAALRETGVPLPETEIRLLEVEGALVPVILQQALRTETMMRPQMQAADLPRALAMMEAAGGVIADFWNAADGFETRIGFHPSIRNFAVEDDRAIFFDTFPPLIHYSRDEMGRLLLQFSEKRLMRMIGPLMRARVTAIQDEWYSPPETVVGIVGSACRLRPGDSAAFLDWGRDFAARRMRRWEAEIIEGLARPPRLPREWTALRKLLGLQGEPNL